MRLLLGSGGFSTPERQAGWKRELDSFLGPVKSLLFVPYALADHDAYVKKVIERGFHVDREIVGIHTAPDPRQAVTEADAIFVGGGNSFRLLHDLYKNNLLEIVRERVRSGKLLYIGVSAGTNMACPTLKTTNDMPIVMPPSFDAFGLIPFQINPHYFAGSIHFQAQQDRQGQQGLIPYAGETRDDRIREFHEMNATPVLGLWEGSILRIEGERKTLAGEGGARLFRRGENPRDFAPGAEFVASIF